MNASFSHVSIMEPVSTHKGLMNVTVHLDGATKIV